MHNNLLIAANFKMNPAPEGINNPDSPYKPRESVDVLVFPTYADISLCVQAGLNTGAQYGREGDIGAFTGDMSMKMLAEMGCKYVLCGHSERRQYHNETDEDVAAQVSSAIEHGLHPIICVGENAEQRDRGDSKKVVGSQLDMVIDKCRVQSTECRMSIAYEPVWAIGTGKTATPEMAQEMHSFIRGLLPTEIQDKIRIIYGGSMKPENASELLSQPDINGGLIGGASLVPQAFEAIIKATENL